MQDGLTLDVLLDMMVFEDLETANAKLAPHNLVAQWVNEVGGEVELRTTFGGFVCRVGANAIATAPGQGDLFEEATNAAGVELTNAQEDSEAEFSPVPVSDERLDPYAPYQSNYRGAVKEGDNDDYAQQLEERFRFLLTNPDSNLAKLLQFYAHGRLDTSGVAGIPQVAKNYEPKVFMPLFEKTVALSDVPVSDVKTVDSTSDERTVNNTMRHAYRVLTDDEKAKMLAIKDMSLAFWELVDSLGSSRELSNAKTRIEEASMWAIKHLTA